MAAYHYEQHNLDGRGNRLVRVYPVAPTGTGQYWDAVTNVPCPIETCDGVLRWYEAGYVPGYRCCDKCGGHFLAKGTHKQPTLLRVGQRRTPQRQAT